MASLARVLLMFRARKGRTMKRLLQTVTILSLLLAVAAPASANECEGVELSNAVRVDGQPLVLNGMGVREATVFNVNVYVAGLYLEHRSRDANTILSTDQRRRLVLRFVRDVSASDIREAFTSGFRQNAGAQASALSARIATLNGYMADMSDGGTLQFTYVPGTGLEVKVGNRVRGTIEGEDFARAFFSIWLGSSPPNGGLKTGLLGGACG